MRTTLSQQKFLDSETAIDIRSRLMAMMADPLFNTTATYAATREDMMTFVEKHMTYLSDHPKLNPEDYLRNLRLMTRLKT
ncbi:MAG: hypothetical protein QFB87_02555 [Patescibacteria group bacterium]|nr:hypothetical protein [Patescibacteria group bacterium]